MKTEYSRDEMREWVAGILLGMLRIHKNLVVEAMHIAVERFNIEYKEQQENKHE